MRQPPPRGKRDFAADASRLAHGQGERQRLVSGSHSSAKDCSGEARQLSFVHVTIS
jgi:hypothetical protein